jgi:hypothetical protein
LLPARIAAVIDGGGRNPDPSDAHIQSTFASSLTERVDYLHAAGEVLSRHQRLERPDRKYRLPLPARGERYDRAARRCVRPVELPPH